MLWKTYGKTPRRGTGTTAEGAPKYFSGLPTVKALTNIKRGTRRSGASKIRTQAREANV